MSKNLGIIGASGKLGTATLTALLSYKLIPPDELVLCTSAHSDSVTWASLSSHSISVRYATFDDGATIEKALYDCDRLFLISSPRISLDYPDAGPGTGREADHYVAIQAALAAGIKHIYYASLAFGNPSVAGVMRAHVRTEKYLASIETTDVTILRQGLYNESWPLYLGYFEPKGDAREKVDLAGDGRVSWTALPDLGLANALILAQSPAKWRGRTVYLSAPQSSVRTLSQVAKIVGEARGRDLSVRKVSEQEHIEIYTGRGIPEDDVRWWVTSYEALQKGECDIEDSTLLDLLKTQDRQVISMETTIHEALQPL